MYELDLQRKYQASSIEQNSGIDRYQRNLVVVVSSCDYLNLRS